MIYFIQGEITKLIKIGYTKSRKELWGRFYIMQIGSPDKLNVLGVIVGGTRRKEKELHKRFEHLNIRGEWFKPSKLLLGYIKDISKETITSEVKTITSNRWTQMQKVINELYYAIEEMRFKRNCSI